MDMKRVIQFTAMAGVVFCLYGCATTKNYESAIQSWNGAPKQALVHEWGTPTTAEKLKNGGELYTYRTVEKVQFSKTYEPVVPTGRISPQSRNSMLSHAPVIMQPHDETFWCETQFKINHAGMIVSTHFDGNNCAATKNHAKKWTFTN